MSANAENIKTQVNKYIRNYAVEGFQNMRLNAILLQLIDLADVATGGVGNGSVIVELTSADFINATDCPLTTLADKSICVFMNEISRFILKDASEWSDLAGGGFRVNISGFNATTNSYHFYVFVK